MNDLIKNIEKIHTTDLSIIRVRKNLSISCDVTQFCKNILLDDKTLFKLQGKNWYVTYKNILLTINKTSFTIITGHIIK